MEYKGYKGVIPNIDTTVKKWLYTRKRSEHEFLTIGNFKFSGIYTVQNFKSDWLFFWIAFICEVGFLILISILLGGFDPLISLSALACVSLDFIGAFFRHKNEDEICKAQLKVNIERYKREINRSTNDDVKIKESHLRTLKSNSYRIFGSSLIILSAIVKIFGSIILFEIPALTITLTVIYCFVAWIHIFKTGFYISAVRFYSSLKKDLAEHIRNGNNDTIKKKDKDEDFDKWELENVPDNTNLKEIRMYVFQSSNIYDSLINEGGKWMLRKWKHHKWDDNDLQNFIDSQDAKGGVLSDNAKSFIASDISERRFLNLIQ